MATENAATGLPEGLIQTLRNSFVEDPTCKLAQMVATKANIRDVFVKPILDHEQQHLYNYQVREVKPVTHQRSSGRCWIFALLNCMRVPFAQKHGLADFEFSQNHMCYWDKLERAYFELQNYLIAARKGVEIDSRLMAQLLLRPVEDGGQWDMLVNLVNKYGVMPKTSFHESATVEMTVRMNNILRAKMREFCRDIYKMVVNDKLSDAYIKDQIDKVMYPILYRIITICLGEPPKEFTWTYKAEGKVQSVGPITPKQFYESYVKPIYDVNDKITLINDPRPGKEYNQTYTVEYLNNMVNANPVLYMNESMGVIKAAVMSSIKAGEPVWFGSHIDKEHNRNKGWASMAMNDYDLVFGTNIQTMTKSDRLVYYDSFMTHAMTITGVHTVKGVTDTATNEDTKRWRVENSWGGDYGVGGYLSVQDDWMDQFVYQVVVDKKHVPTNVIENLQRVPIVLPAWDPFGTVASCEHCIEEQSRNE